MIRYKLDLFYDVVNFCNASYVMPVMSCILNLCLEFSGG